MGSERRKRHITLHPRPRARSFPETADAYGRLRDLLRLLHVLALASGSPPQLLRALVDAGVAPALAKLLCYWAGFLAGFFAQSPDPMSEDQAFISNYLILVVAGLAERSPGARCQLRCAGAASKLRAIVAEPKAVALLGASLHDALRHLGPA